MVVIFIKSTKRRRNILLIVFAIIVFAALIAFSVLRRESAVDMNFATEVTAVYKYNNANISQSLSAQELSLICEIFDGKNLYSDSPSCGFSENVSLQFNDGQTFCIACDTCPIIYWKQKNKFFKISEKEKDQLYNILMAYGFAFPCV